MGFSDRLIELRKEKNLTQGKLAEILKISPSLIGMYEQGRRMPSYEKLEEIADYFNVDMDYLMARTNTRHKIKFLDPYYVDTSMLTDAQKTELNTIINMNVAMFNSSRELSEHDRKTIIKVLTEAFINTLPNKEV